MMVLMAGKRCRKMHFLVVLMASCFYFGGTASSAECQAGSAIGFYTHVTVAGIESMSGRIPANEVEQYLDDNFKSAISALPQSCQKQFQLRQKYFDGDCANILNQGQSHIAAQLKDASELYKNDGNKIFLFAKTHEAMKNFVAFVPHRCWFGNISAGGYSGGKCEFIENNYRNCKRQVERSLKKCSVTPGPCRDLGPTCVLPSSINSSCSP